MNSTFRELLVDLIPEDQDARRVAVDAGLNIGRLKLGGNQQNRWFEILREARLQKKYDDLVEVVVREAPKRESEIRTSARQHRAKESPKQHRKALAVLMVLLALISGGLVGAWRGFSYSDSRFHDVAHRLIRCQMGADATGCTLLLQQEEGRCSEGKPDACLIVGMIYQQGRPGVPADRVRAAHFFRLACQRGEPDGCYYLGVLQEKLTFLLDPEGKYVDAINLYRVACAQDHLASCARLGRLLIISQVITAPQLEQEGVQLFERACAGGSQLGCVDLGYMYNKGRGGLKQDLKKAYELFTKACAAGEAIGCYNLGVLAQESGQGQEQRALENYNLACEMDDPDACYAAGRIYATNKEPGPGLGEASAQNKLKKACDLGNADGCNLLGYIIERGEGLSRNEPNGNTFYEKAWTCEQGACRKASETKDGGAICCNARCQTCAKSETTNGGPMVCDATCNTNSNSATADCDTISRLKEPAIRM